MKLKKFLSLICSFSILTSSLFCCKATHDLSKKVVIFGNAKVGKTQLWNRIFNNGFNENYSPTIESHLKFLKNQDNDKSITFHIWDTSSFELYRASVQRYFINNDLGLFVCSADDAKSVQDFDTWVDNYTYISFSNNIIVALNKCDLKNSEEVEQIRATLIEKLRSKNVKDPENRVIAVSAKDNVNIDKLVDCIINHTVLLPQETKFVPPYEEYIEEEYDDEQENIGHEKDEPEQKNTNKKAVTIGLIGTAIFGGTYALYKKCISKITLHHIK